MTFQQSHRNTGLGLLVAAAVVLLTVQCGKSTETSTAPSPTPGVTRIIGLSGDIAFGNVQVGSRASKPLTVTNSGNSPLTVNGTGGDTVLDEPLKWGWDEGSVTAVIAAGGSKTMTIWFVPTVAKTWNERLVVLSDKTSGNDTITVTGTGTAAPQCRYPQAKLRVQITSSRCQALSNSCQSIYVVASSPQISSYIASGRAVCTSRSGNGCAVSDVRGWTRLFCGDVGECGTHDFDLRASFGPAMDNSAINISDTVSFCPFYADGSPAGTCVQSLVNQCSASAVILMLIN